MPHANRLASTSTARPQSIGKAGDVPRDVTVFWRPGCPYCSRLTSKLDKAGVVRIERNIWADDDAAATVRSLANGNETVPTVVVGTTALVNPSIGEVLAAMGDDAPTSSRRARWGRRP